MRSDGFGEVTDPEHTPVSSRGRDRRLAESEALPAIQSSWRDDVESASALQARNLVTRLRADLARISATPARDAAFAEDDEPTRRLHRAHIAPPTPPFSSAAPPREAPGAAFLGIPGRTPPRLGAPPSAAMAGGVPGRRAELARGRENAAPKSIRLTAPPPPLGASALAVPAAQLSSVSATSPRASGAPATPVVARSAAVPVPAAKRPKLARASRTVATSPPAGATSGLSSGRAPRLESTWVGVAPLPGNPATHRAAAPLSAAGRSPGAAPSSSPETRAALQSLASPPPGRVRSAPLVPFQRTGPPRRPASFDEYALRNRAAGVADPNTLTPATDEYVRAETWSMQTEVVQTRFDDEPGLGRVARVLTWVRSAQFVSNGSVWRASVGRARSFLAAANATGAVPARPYRRVWSVAAAICLGLCAACTAAWVLTRTPQTEAAVEMGPTEAELARIMLARTGFMVSTYPAGARIHVDGRETGRYAPERVTGLTPGLHSIELKLAGYYDTNLPAVLEEGSTLVLPPVELRPLPPQPPTEDP